MEYAITDILIGLGLVGIVGWYIYTLFHRKQKKEVFTEVEEVKPDRAPPAPYKTSRKEEVVSRAKKEVVDADDMALSMAVAAATNSTALGYIAGGSIAGAIIGDALVDDEVAEDAVVYSEPEPTPEPDSNDTWDSGGSDDSDDSYDD